MTATKMMQGLFGLLALAFISPFAFATGWQPIDASELQMTGEPKAPGAPAIILYRQVDRNDNAATEEAYIRIKILTDEGRKYGDIEVVYDKNEQRVGGIQARTIRPDGSAIEFDGDIYDKPVVQGRGVKLMAKTFTLPEVQTGSIIEYRYKISQRAGYVFDSVWVLSNELFTKHAKFSLEQSDYFAIRFAWPMGLPPGTDPPSKQQGRIRLETFDVPAFVTEDFMPPEAAMKYRVEFIYVEGKYSQKDPEKFWKIYAKDAATKVNRYINEKKVMREAVAQIADATDTPEVKLRKLYARAQQVRNLSYEKSKTEEEAKREKLKDVDDVEEVWRRGYGNGLQVTWLFLALARAAGFEADPVLVSTRNRYFFDARTMNPWQINSNVVVVNLDGKDLYLDPGTPFVPFGLLPWPETGVRGMRLTDAGGKWIETPLPDAKESQVQRSAKLRMLPSGSLEGTLTVTYTGLEALWRRIEEQYEDPTDRKEFLESQIKADVPVGIEVKLSNSPDWSSSDAPLVAEFQLKVPGWAASLGQRKLLALGLFGRAEQHIFERANREHPLYFTFPNQSEDTIGIEIPDGWNVVSLPKPQSKDLKVTRFETGARQNGRVLELTRTLSSNLLLLDRKFYPTLQNFYQIIRTADEQQIVLERGKAGR